MIIEERMRDTFDFSLAENKKVEISVDGEVKKTFIIPAGKRAVGTVRITGKLEEM